MVWYEEEVVRLEAEKAANKEETRLVFFGSSSIRLWETLSLDFADYRPVNFGFGGSTLAACGWFFERIFKDVHPWAIIIYAGDNDLGDGRHPEEVFLFYKQLLAFIRKKYGNIPAGFISIKPSIARWDIVDKIRQTNRLIEADIRVQNDNTCFIDIFQNMTDKTGYPKQEFLMPDGLHINELGYAMWKEVIMSYAQDGRLQLEKG